MYVWWAWLVSYGSFGLALDNLVLYPWLMAMFLKNVTCTGGARYWPRWAAIPPPWPKINHIYICTIRPKQTKAQRPSFFYATAADACAATLVPLGPAAAQQIYSLLRALGPCGSLLMRGGNLAMCPPNKKAHEGIFIDHRCKWWK
jgi:hypothetical protein